MGRPGNPDRRAGHQGLTKQQIQGDRAEEIAFQLLQRKGWKAIGTGLAVGGNWI